MTQEIEQCYNHFLLGVLRSFLRYSFYVTVRFQMAFSLLFYLSISIYTRANLLTLLCSPVMYWSVTHLLMVHFLLCNFMRVVHLDHPYLFIE